MSWLEVIENRRTKVGISIGTGNEVDPGYVTMVLESGESSNDDN
jgi:hypothetical protein